MLCAAEVSFAYPAGTGAAAAVLNGVSIEVRPGQILGILGPNGSGKTTLLRLLGGTRHPTTGEVRLDGTSLTALTRREIARRIAVVPQETQVVFEYTALEMVLMGRHPHLGMFALEGPADYAAAHDALAATGTAVLAHRRFTTLSGGEKQRVVIAAALAQASSILLLDEPTASLDLGYQLEIATLVRRLRDTRGVSIVISTHDLNLAASLCDALVLLQDGRVRVSGPTREVLTREHILGLYGVDVDVQQHERTGQLVVVPIGRAAS